MNSVRNLLCSSAPVRRSTKREIMDFFLNSSLFEAYGSTEAGVPVLLRPEDQMRKLGSIGREMIGVGRIKLLDEKGDEVPVGKVGEIYTTQPSGFKEYWNSPEETRKALKGKYFTAGDMAYKDEDGFFYLVDRKQNMIITGGENVYPSEVEKIVMTYPSVKEVCVIGVPDKKWGETIKAVVVLKDGIEGTDDLKEEIMAFCKGKIAAYKRPRSVDFIALEDVPRTATGKVIYGALRDKYGRWSDDLS
jgi:fatty-acyl-CoA synthase